jgi:hypothetical protein
MPAMHKNLKSMGSTGTAGGRGRAQLLAVVALACAGAVLSACGSSKSTTSTNQTGKPLNTSQVAASIEESILKERGIHATVICPNTVLVEKGKKFECLATSKSTQPPHNQVRTPFVVTIETERGYVTYVGK